MTQQRDTQTPSAPEPRGQELDELDERELDRLSMIVASGRFTSEHFMDLMRMIVRVLNARKDTIARLQREAEGLRRERDEARREIDEMRARHKAWLVDGVSVENDARRYRAICMRARGFGDYTIGIVAEHDHSGHVQRLIGPEADEVIDGLPHPDSETQG